MEPPNERYPGPHPRPPRRLSRTELPIRVTTQSWFRFHRLDHPALYWGLKPPRPFAFRFDPQSGEYGVLYVGADEHCAFIETFGHSTGIRRVAMSDLRTRSLARIDVGRPLRLVDLTGPGLARLGADMRLTTGDYHVAQQWALALYRHPESPDGILYPSRHDNQRTCAAILDRAEEHVTAVTLGPLANRAHITLLRNILETYRFGLGGR